MVYLLNLSYFWISKKEVDEAQNWDYTYKIKWPVILRLQLIIVNIEINRPLQTKDQLNPLMYLQNLSDCRQYS